ncbi:MAG: asparagine--tRNA ligase [Bacteroidota bacterium]
MSAPHRSVSALAEHVGQPVVLKGWVYNARYGKGLAFVEVRDGSGIVQVVVSEAEVSAEAWEAAQSLTQETALEVSGAVVEDRRQTGGVEVRATDLTVVSHAEPYPITPKEHGIEFLMDRRHLWLRSRRQWAIARVRNRVIMAIHGYFQDDGFIQMDAPILTGNAVEGTSTLFELDYFEEPAYLTQSGQLHGEAMAMAHGKIYTFGPTFRAEKSKTRRHLTEFWMIEPEMAYHDLAMNMDVAEGLLHRIVAEVLDTCADELSILGRDTAALSVSREGPYPRLSYTEAVDLLTSEATQTLLRDEQSARMQEQAKLESERDANAARYGQAKKGEKRRIDARRIEIDKRLAQIEEDLRNLPRWMESARTFEWGADFGGSDETVLTKHFDRPILVHRYPAAVKAFYMKRDPEDDRLALGMDVLAPEGYGEIVGGGERATDLQFLRDQVAAHGLPESAFDWYFDLRRYGSVPHAGFGLGLERTVAWVCGLSHLREAIPFPRLIGRLHP